MFSYFIKDANCIIVFYDNAVTSTCFNCLERSSCFAEYGERVPNKDNNKLINKNIPMKLNEHLSEVVETKDFSKYHKLLQKIQSNTNSTRHKSQNGETHSENISQTILKKLSDAIDAGAYTGLDPNGLFFKSPIDPKEYKCVSANYTPRLTQREVNLLNKVKGIALEEGIKFSAKENKTKKEETLADKKQNHLSTRHKSPNGQTHQTIESKLKQAEELKNEIFNMWNVPPNKNTGYVIPEKEIKTDEEDKWVAPKDFFEKPIGVKESQVTQKAPMFNTVDPKEYEYVSLGFTPKLNQEQVNLLNRVKNIAFQEGIKNSEKETKTEEKDSVTNKEELQSYNLYDNLNYLTHLGKKLEGVKQSQTTQKAYKETDGKLYYELDWGFIKQMAERMESNKKEGKYEMFNWKKPMTFKGIEELKQAALRHLIEVLEGKYEDDGRPFGHIEAISDNMMMINFQLKNGSR